jgi:hypothetical protein
MDAFPYNTGADADKSRLKIIRTVTADGPFGEPWPPADGDGWTVIRRSHGFTVWRKIQITKPDPPPARKLVVYDGRVHIGTLRPCDGARIEALDASGRRLGIFPNIKLAMAAINSEAA